MFSSIRQYYQIMKDHSNVTKMHFWMIQRAKKEVFGHFLEFGLLDWLDIAYCDSTKCFPPVANVTRSWKIIQKPQKCNFDPMSRKRSLWPFPGLWSLRGFHFTEYLTDNLVTSLARDLGSRVVFVTRVVPLLLLSSSKLFSDVEVVP